MNKLKHILANWILAQVFKAPLIEEVFTELNPDKREEYALEAKQILESKFYIEFLRLMEQLAITKMARESNTATDMLFGKAMIYYVLTQRTKLKEFASYEKPKTGEPVKW
jgi:hypothetical protein